MRKVGALFLGLTFVVAGVCLILFLGEHSVLACSRPDPSQTICQLTNSTLVSQQVTPISQLQSAEITESTSKSRKRRDRSKTYRIVLITSSGRIPFTRAYSSDPDPKERNLAQINAFLSTPSQSSLKIEQDDRGLMILIGSVFIIVGGISGFVGVTRN